LSVTVLSCSQVDWAKPWWQGWQARVQPVWHSWETGTEPLSAVLNRQSAGPVHFVPQADLPLGWAYEQFIFKHRQVPTRDNLHDLFNACCWQRFPRTKTRLNALQGEVIAREGVQATRGPLRDALTLFDENALLLLAPAKAWQALCRHDWTELFVGQRDAWGAAGSLRAVVFGHALLEKLCQPYKSITAHAYWVPAGEEAGGLGARLDAGFDTAGFADDDRLDAWLASRLTAEHLNAKPFSPLPVMGIPGWCDDNRHANFYIDAQVFRPRSGLVKPAK
jgi:hypothetical protein